jgi:hypothetical protein
LESTVGAAVAESAVFLVIIALLVVVLLAVALQALDEGQLRDVARFEGRDITSYERGGLA